jgi:hypothetical protein
MPERPTPLRVEAVGPDGLNVAGWAPREIMVHALNTVLYTEQRVQQLASGMALEVESIKEDLAAVRGHVLEIRERQGQQDRQPWPPPPMPRPPEDSWHEIDPELANLRQGLVGKIKDPHHPLSEASALRLIRAEAERVREATDARTWNRLKAWMGTRVGKAVDRVVSLLVASGIGFLLHHFLLR